MAQLFERRADGRDLTVSTSSGSPVFVAPEEIAVQMENLWVRLSLHRPTAPSSVAVTSYLRGEGVTTVAAALALAASRRGPTVLVDGNLARPHLLASADGDQGGGLRSVLTGSATLDEAIIATDHDQLSVLPVGSATGPAASPSGEAPPPLELQPGLAKELVGALSMLHTTVIVDAPSLQEPAAALAQASACDATLLTVRHGVTDIEQAKAAADELEDVDLLGVVLNNARLRTPSWLRSRLGDLL